MTAVLFHRMMSMWRASCAGWARTSPGLARYPRAWWIAYACYVVLVIWTSLETRAWAQLYKPSAMIGWASTPVFWLVTAFGCALPILLFLLGAIDRKAVRSSGEPR